MERRKKKEEKEEKKASKNLNFLEKKKKQILDSKIPESQKIEYIARLEGTKKEKVGVPFVVYAKLRGIKQDLQRAMLAFPKCQGIEVATLKQWDEIFKDF